MDKIIEVIEEFEKEFPKTPYFEYDGTWYTCDKKTLKEYRDSYSSVTCYNRLLHGFRKGHTSRDEEVRDLQEQIGYLRGDVINMQGKYDEEVQRLHRNITIKDAEIDSRCEDYLHIKAKNKKLKDALERIVTEYNQHLDYDNFPDCTIPWFANRAQFVAKKTLKDVID